MGGRGREPPERHVLQGRLPACQQPGRDVAGRGGPVQLGEPAGAVGVGVVRRQAGLLEQLQVDVVQCRDGAADLGGQPRPRRQVGQLQRAPGQVGVDRSPATLLERDEPLGGRHREGEPPGQEPEQGHRDVHPGPGSAGQRRAHHPPAVLGVLDEGQLELLPGRACRPPRRSPGPVRERPRWPGRRGQEHCGSPGHRMSKPAPRVEGVSRSSETLLDLSLSRGALDRAAELRKDPELLPRLLGDRATRVLELVGGSAEVVEARGEVALHLRPPHRGDLQRARPVPRPGRGGHVVRRGGR